MATELVWDTEYTGPRWTYGMTHRPPAYAHQPDGRIGGADRPHPLYAYGTIQYPRELTPEEIARYELAVPSERELAGQRRLESEGYGRPTEEVAAEIVDRRGTVVAYVPDPSSRQHGTWPDVDPGNRDRTEEWFRKDVRRYAVGLGSRIQWDPATGGPTEAVGEGRW